MRSLVLRSRPKTFRSYGKSLITKVRKASNRMYKNISKRMNKFEINDVLEGTQKRMKFVRKETTRWMRANRKRITRASWYREMQKGTYIPKRYKRVKRTLNSNYVMAKGWVKGQVPKIRNFSSRSTSNLADFANSTYSSVESYFSTRLPRAQRWVANTF